MAAEDLLLQVSFSLSMLLPQLVELLFLLLEESVKVDNFGLPVLPWSQLWVVVVLEVEEKRVVRLLVQLTRPLSGG